MGEIKYILILFFKYLYPQKHNINILFNLNTLFSPVFIFIIGLVLYFAMFYIVLQEKRIQQNIFTMEDRFVLYELIDHKLHVKNIRFTLFKMFLYGLFTFFIYLALRLYMLYSKYSLSQLNLYSYFTFKNFIFIIFFLLFLGMFRLFLNMILYKDVLRIYLYFSNRYNEYLVECITYFDFPSWRPGNFLHILYFRLNVFFIRVIDGEKVIILFNKDLKNIFSKLYPILCFMDTYTKPLIQETAWITILIALIYDITQKNLYYIYFASFIFLLRILYRKFGDFIYQLDVFKDKTLYEYMYKTPYKPHIAKNEARIDILNELEEKNGVLTLEQQKEHNDILECYMVQFQMDGNRESFIEYVKNDLVENKPITERNLKVRKFIFLLISVICYIYLNIYTEIITIITINTQQISFQYQYIILFLVLVNTYFWYRNNIKFMNIIFWIISLVVTLSTLIIFINHNIPLMYTDVLFNTYNVTITDYYTIKEKINFIQHYLSFIIQNDKETQEYLLKILKDIPLNKLLQKNTDLATMKAYAHNLIVITGVLEQIYNKALYYNNIHVNNDIILEWFLQTNKFLSNSIIIMTLTTLLTKTTLLLVTIEKIWNNFPELCYNIVKILAKYWFR